MDYYTITSTKEIKNSTVIPYFTDEHDYGDAYYIMPVTIKMLNGSEIRLSDVDEIDDEISIPSLFVKALLRPVFMEFFEPEMLMNTLRALSYKTNNGRQYNEYVTGWDDNLMYNFFTYKRMEELLLKLTEYADALEAGEIDKLDDKIKEGMDILYGDNSEDNKKVIYYRTTADFYRKLVNRIEKMMTDNQTDMISIMGP